MPQSENDNLLNRYFANLVVEERKKAGYTLKQMDEKLGLSSGVTSRLERGSKRIDTHNLFNLIGYLGISIDEFFEQAPEIDLIPADEADQAIPLKEIEELLNLYGQISNKKARYGLLDFVRTVSKSPLYGSEHG